MVSRQTKDSLAAAKARGKERAGNRSKVHLVAKKGALASAAIRSGKAKRRAADIGPIVEDIRASGATSLRQIAAGLNAREIRTPRGGEWSTVQINRMLDHLKRATL